MNQMVEHLSSETVLLEPALMVCVWDKNKWVEFEDKFEARWFCGCLVNQLNYLKWLNNLIKVMR